MVDRACSNSDWDFANGVLYDLCADYPLNSDPSEVIAKIWLIGRGYAAAIERVKDKLKNVSDFYVEIAGPGIVSANIDEWLQPLAGRELEPSVVPDVLAAHQILTELFLKLTGRSKRSLASKYLHFHFPKLFFIYDSRAVKALGRLSWMFEYEYADSAGYEFDAEYAVLVDKCMILRDDIAARSSIVATPRQIDNLLLRLAPKKSG